MITKINVLNPDEVIISFDTRPDFTVVSDNGAAEIMADWLLSPRYDMPRTQYFAILEAEDEITEIIPVEYAS